METGFDYHELSEFKKQVLQLAKEDFPKETKKFIKKEAGKLAKIAKKTAQKELDSKTGNYVKGFKSGKVYFYSGDLCCRAYNNSPHGHLIEFGHNMVTPKSKRNVGFIPGKYILTKSTNQFNSVFETNVDSFLGQILDKGLQ